MENPVDQIGCPTRRLRAPALVMEEEEAAVVVAVTAVAVTAVVVAEVTEVVVTVMTRRLRSNAASMKLTSTRSIRLPWAAPLAQVVCQQPFQFRRERRERFLQLLGVSELQYFGISSLWFQRTYSLRQERPRSAAGFCSDQRHYHLRRFAGTA